MIDTTIGTRDEHLQNQIKKMIDLNLRFTLKDVEVISKHGNIILNGKINSLTAKNELSVLICSLSGVNSLRNRLEINE